MRRSATVSLLDVAKREIVGTVDINPDKVVVQRPGTPNYAQDTDVSPDGRTLYVARGYMGDVAAFDIASGKPHLGGALWNRTRRSHDADAGRQILFVSVMFDNQVEKIDAATGEGKGRFSVPGSIRTTTRSRKTERASTTPASARLRHACLVQRRAESEARRNPMQFTVADLETLEVKRSHSVRFPHQAMAH